MCLDMLQTIKQRHTDLKRWWIAGLVLHGESELSNLSEFETWGG